MRRRSIGYGLSTALGAGIIGIGVRFLAAPQVAAAGYGQPVTPGGAGDPYLAAKGVRDIAAGVAALTLMASGEPVLLGRYMLAASLIPIGDAAIVLRHGGPKATAFGVHGVTAAVMFATAALLADRPEAT
jgi:hypothetical protein